MSIPTISRRHLPLLPPDQTSGMSPELTNPVAYRKSGISLNHIVGCPLNCGYCVRHLFQNFEMKTPRALMSDEEAVALLVQHPFFRPHATPIQLFNRATEPMLPVVKPHTFNVLRLLNDQGLTNHVLIITRWRVEPEDCAVLNSFTILGTTILVTHSGIDDPRIEPVDSNIAATSLRTLYEHAQHYRTVLYWRPIVHGLNDTDEHLERARHLSRHAHALSRHLPTWEPAGVIDTLRLAKATYKDLPTYTLDAVIKHAQPDLSQAPRVGRHCATYDAYATAQLLLTMANHYATWDQLIAAAVPPGLPGPPQPEGDPTLW